MKYYKIILILFAFTSCDVSTISKNDTKNISKLKANIYIQDDGKDELLNEIKVNLTDGKKQIINNKITILLNGKPLELFVKQELYYTTTSFYKDTNLVRRNSYYFEIILPDSTKYPLAFLKPLKKKDSAKFYIPKEASRNENVTLMWKNINTPAKLEVWKLVHPKKKNNEHSGSRHAETKILESINSKSGKYIIPKSFLTDSLTVTDYLKVRLNKQENGLINPKLLIGSSITYDYTIEDRIDIKEE